MVFILKFMPALDVLRLAGLAPVTLQYCLTLLVCDVWTRVVAVDGMFCLAADRRGLAPHSAECWWARMPGERLTAGTIVGEAF